MISIRYIFFDIDGTLVSHSGISHIPDETKEAVRLLREAGHVPAIATGRGSFLTMTVAREFGMNYLVCSGGAQVFADGIEIHRAYFPDEHLSQFRDVANRFPEVSAAVDGQFLYTAGAFEDFRDYFNNQAGYDCIRDINDMKRAIICYIMLSPETLTSEHGIFFTPPESVRLELMHNFTEARYANSTKWHGIELLLHHEGANLDDVITFGDGPNDIDMLRNAKIGVAVGNASESVKEAADYVCDDIDSGGILNACKYLGLI